MAVGDRELAITLRAVIDPLVAGLRDAGNRVKEFATQTEESFALVEESGERISRLWKAMFEAFIGFEMLEGLKQIAEQTNEANDALEIAARTAANFGKDFHAEEMERYLEQLAKSAAGGGYALQQLRSGVQQFVAAGASGVQAERLIADAANLAAARHMDLAQAVQIVMYAMTGHFEMLTRYGIVSREAAKNIKTVAEAIEAVEKATSGAAEERARGLEGSFGRLSASARLLTESLGSGLIPLFEGLSNALARMADAFARLPRWVSDAAGAFAFFGVSLGATALLMPGVVKLGAIMGDGFGLLRATVATVSGVFSLFGGVLGNIVVQGARGVIAALSVLRATLLGVAASEATAATPILAIIAGFAVLAVGVYELQQHFDELAKTFARMVNFMGSAWREFVSHFTHDGQALTLYTQGLMRLFSGDVSGGAGDMWAAFHMAMPKTSDAIYQGMKSGIDAGIGHLKSAWNDVIGWFKGAFGAAPTIPHADLSDLGGTGSKNGAQKAINDALTIAKGAIQAALDAAAANVQRAADRLDVAKANLEAFKATLVGGKPTTDAQVLEEQRLLHEEQTAELNQRKAIAVQMEAQKTAASQLLQLARALPAADKDRVSHVQQLTAEARKHTDEVLKLQAAYIRLGGTIAQIPAEIRKAWEELRAQQRDVATLQLQGGLHNDQSAIQAQLEQLRFREASGRAAGTLSKTDEAEIAQSRTQLQMQLANLAVAAAQAKLALDEFYKADRKTLATDQNTLTNAVTAQRKAQDDLTLSTQALQQAQDQAAHAFMTTIEKKLLGGVPGLSVGASGGLAFDFATFLADAAQKSKAFGDVMQFVGEVVQVVAQIIDAFRPVIDLLLKGLALIVNGFVTLWNAIAHVLRILGIHVEYLHKINTDFGQMHQVVAPLIRIVHDIPTLNELASGNVAPLIANSGSASSAWNQPITDALKDPGLGGGILGALGSILEAILALKIVLGAFGGGGGGFLGMAAHYVEHKIGSWLGLGGSAGSGAMSVTQAETIDQGLGGGTGLVSNGTSEVAADARGTSFASRADAWIHSTAGTIAVNAALGVGLGELMGGGTHDVWGGIGGALGGAAAALIPGVGWAGAAGALIGSLFGHHDNPADMPDKYDTQRFGTIVADLVGGMGANGQGFTMNSALAAIVGTNPITGQAQTIDYGTDMSKRRASGGSIAYIEETLAKYAQAGTTKMGGNTPDWLKPMWDQLVSMFGVSASGSGTLNFGKHLNNETITGAMGASGQTYQYTDLGAALDKFYQAIQQVNAAAPQLAANLADSAKAIQRNVIAAGNDLAAAVRAPSDTIQQLATNLQRGYGMDGRVRSADPGAAPTTITVTNHFNGDIHGYQDVEQIGTDIAATTERAHRLRAYQIDRVAFA